MSGWAGFSDAELRRLQQTSDSAVQVSSRGRKPASVTRSRQQIQREQALLKSRSESRPGSSPLPPDQQLNSNAAPKTHRAQSKSEPSRTKQEPEIRPESSPGSKPESKPETRPETRPESRPETNEIQNLEMRERSRLELLQIQQKEMEEKNRKKKALLAKTIAEKSKQTRAETVKLQKIQKELQTLDDMVSNDISILRGRIEQASWDYTSARKRYEKAECEFVAAKLELHKRTELKEQLTEHLCAIIQQNELRKAQKLEELMTRLQLQEEEKRRRRRREKRRREKRRGTGRDEREGNNSG
ncbi:hypothetical protein WMY93_024306 [Mugilogobius chulae]|uniref:RAB6-interacting golgin n=1 Tax=Mugilogobius chulae TaxID=88201 RepID=A0AAW0MZ85_9GOBI